MQHVVLKPILIWIAKSNVDKEAHLLVLGSFFVLSLGLTLFHTFPKDPLDISSVMFTVAGSHLQKHEQRDKNDDFPLLKNHGQKGDRSSYS